MDRNRYFDDEPRRIRAVNSVLEKFGIQFDEEIRTRRFFGRRISDYHQIISGGLHE